MTETQDATELHWERSRNGILFLRRADQLTVGLIVPNEDGSFCWKVPCQRRSKSWPANGRYLHNRRTGCAGKGSPRHVPANGH